MTDELGIQNERRRTDELDIQKTNEDELGMVEINRDDRRTWYGRDQQR